MTLECENCRAIDAEWPIKDEGARNDLGFRRRRRAIFHVKFCMTLAEKAEWLKAGGMRIINALGASNG